MIALILFALLSASASVLHGNGDGADQRKQFWETKGFIVTAHALLSLPFGLFAPLAVAVYWVFLRRGEQAKAEILYLSGVTTLDDVRAAYPLGIGHLVAATIKHATIRREQELISGALLGAILAVPFIVIPTLLGVGL